MALFKLTAVYTLCVLLCICNVQTAVLAHEIHFKYVVHETRSGANATVVTAVGVPGTFAWGSILMNDNVVRATESVTSTLLGKSTGFGAVTQKIGISGGILSFSKVTFVEPSTYSGSSFTLTATFAAPSPTFEAIVLGGTGKFRGCSGYALFSNGLTTLPVYTTVFDVHLTCQ